MMFLLPTRRIGHASPHRMESLIGKKLAVRFGRQKKIRWAEVGCLAAFDTTLPKLDPGGCSLQRI